MLVVKINNEPVITTTKPRGYYLGIIQYYSRIVKTVNIIIMDHNCKVQSKILTGSELEKILTDASEGNSDK